MAAISRCSWKTAKGETRTGYTVDWRDANGVRRRKQFSGQGALRKAKAYRSVVEATPEAIEEPAASAAPEPTQTITVKDGCDAWIKAVQDLGRTEATWSKYEQHRDNHIVAAMIERDGKPVAFGSLQLGQVTGPDCEALKAALVKKTSVPMTRRVMSSVRMMFAHAQRAGTIPASPAQATRVVAATGTRKRVQIPEKPEIKSLLGTAATEAPDPPTFTEVWVNIGVFGGLRPSELRGLAVEDLTLAGKNPGAIVRRKADEKCMLGLTKTENGDRFITFGPQLVALLKRWLLVLPRSSALPDPSRPNKTVHLLLPTSLGTAQTHANVTNRMWVPLCQAAGLTRRAKSRKGETILRPSYPLNTLRHIHASLLIERGMTPKQVQMRMGHSSIQITYDLYGHLFDQRDADRKIGVALERELLR
ncbi:tyrosine-type recombinase/integrase [Inquilinus limosus]|uniref:Tyr recombinase domain-containing protein n=1 Tax=Inquilinus limosus TaxID=171674 RepID=A0A211ZQ64_9PROT|nr:tyrosine-type recombinase/integrase [Inquilinus limosus]OWJ67421.1 hypothetical protein BWR60_09450 [Inquilinus limosus]